MFDFIKKLWAPHNNTETSKAAAAAVKPKLQSQREKVLAFVKEDASGATNEEAALSLNLPIQTVTARMNDLQKAKLVKNSGQTRTTTFGRKAIVWKVV